MKKLLIIGFLLLAAMLAGCNNGPDYNVKMTKPLYFLKNKATPFEVKVTENKKAVTGLKITAEFSMANMDHGTEQVKLTEGENGKYTGLVKLPMDGKYEIDFTLEKDGKKSASTINYTVQKAQGVALINGKWVKNEVIQFYKLVNLIQVEVERAEAPKQYSGDALKEQLAYLDTEEKNSKNEQQILTQIIRIRAMALLAEQRGHQATPEAIQNAISKDQRLYRHNAAAEKLIAQFGAEKFQRLAQEEYKYTILANETRADVRKQTLKENPKVGNQEVDFQTEQSYEDLLQSQMNSLNIEII